MKTTSGALALIFLITLGAAAAQAGDSPVKYNNLNYEEKRVILQKGTEQPFTGEHEDNWDKGTFLCRRCNAPLYRSGDKFNARCGWPSFDDAIKGAVKRTPDGDGRRTEITCNNCGGHLGHVFLNEGMTPKNTRHCVNSVSMSFVEAGDELPPLIAEKAAVAESKEE